MSADNGIYILKTKAAEPVIESDFEYRVSHAQGIENIYWDYERGDYRNDGSFTPEIAFEYFKDCQVFRYMADALALARNLAEETPILEYGICTLDHGAQVFEIFTQEEIYEFEKKGEELMEERRRQRQQEIEKDLARRTAPLVRRSGPEDALATDQGEEFVPSVMYGHLHKSDGSRIHGSVSKRADGKYYFLASK